MVHTLCHISWELLIAVPIPAVTLGLHLLWAGLPRGQPAFENEVQ